MNESVSWAGSGQPMPDFLPVGLFGSKLGLTGFSVVWRLAHEQLSFLRWTPGDRRNGRAGVRLANHWLRIKLVAALAAARAEFRHPIASSLFAALPISLLLPIVVALWLRLLSKVLWIMGAVSIILFA